MDKQLRSDNTLSLSKLYQKQGKHAVALDTLAEIYGWFTEGFDTADLKEAGALLESFRIDRH